MDNLAPRIVFGSLFFEQLKVLEERVIRKVYENFIDPIKRGYCIEELPGKYKPSWIIKAHCSNTAMKCALAEFARKENLYHYHYGFPFYRSGRDTEYFGLESDGILHTVNKQYAGYNNHIIFRVDERHPNPFNVPFDLSVH